MPVVEALVQKGTRKLRLGHLLERGAPSDPYSSASYAEMVCSCSTSTCATGAFWPD